MTKTDDENVEYNKKNLRRLVIEKRLAIDVKERRKLDRYILEHLINSDYYIRSSIILTYASYNGEVDTRELITRALNEGKQVGCPVSSIKNGEPVIDFFYIDSADKLTAGYKGIPEPDVMTAVKVSEHDISRALIIVPIVAYDGKRSRLGYGKGFYDRFFALHEYSSSIGLAYSLQECINVPTERYDIKPDMIITEKGII